MTLKGNNNAEKHGGEAAVRAIQRGEPLTGLAVEAAALVQDELELHGIDAVMKRDAIRLQATADLYWNAIEKAAQDGDIDKLDRYVARFGWLCGVSMRAWIEVRKADKDRHNDAISLDELHKYRADPTVKEGDDAQDN